MLIKKQSGTLKHRQWLFWELWIIKKQSQVISIQVFKFILSLLLIVLYYIIFLLKESWQWHPTPVLLPGKYHGWRSLVGCSPWGRYESDMTERLHFDFSLSCIVEGNGNPLQCSCLDNPRDGGAWWAAISEVAQSRTRLKWLSSSSKDCLKSQIHQKTLLIRCSKRIRERS